MSQHSPGYSDHFHYEPLSPEPSQAYPLSQSGGPADDSHSQDSLQSDSVQTHYHSTQPPQLPAPAQEKPSTVNPTWTPSSSARSNSYLLCAQQLRQDWLSYSCCRRQPHHQFYCSHLRGLVTFKSAPPLRFPAWIQRIWTLRHQHVPLLALLGLFLLEIVISTVLQTRIAPKLKLPHPLLWMLQNDGLVKF